MVASFGGDPCQNDAKRPFTGNMGAFMGLFAVLYVFAVALLPLWGEKRGFKGGLWVWGASLIGFAALRGF